jgi:hypothetical protein
VIGCDVMFPSLARECEVMAQQPEIWADIVAFVRERGLLLAERDGCIAYFCPFGTFPRSYDIISLEDRVRLVDLPEVRRRSFVALLYEVLRLLGPIALDYEIHEGGGLPLHAHVNARHYAYSNIGGTLNLPATLPGGPK